MRQFIFFSAAGISGFVVDYLVFNVLLQIASIHISRAIGFFVAVNLTYAVNKKYTFRTGNLRYGHYIIGQLQGILINFFIFELCLFFFPLSDSLALVAFLSGSASAMLFNFFYAKNIALKL